MMRLSNIIKPDFDSYYSQISENTHQINSLCENEKLRPVQLK